MRALVLFGCAVALLACLLPAPSDGAERARFDLTDGRVGRSEAELVAQSHKSASVVRFFTAGKGAWMPHRRHETCRTVTGERRQPLCRKARRILKAHRWLHGLAEERLLANRMRHGFWVLASWYGPGLYGNTMACGGVLTPSSMVVAHRTLPCFTRVLVCYRGRCVQAVVQDRGPFIAGRDIDLGPGVATALGFGGVAPVRLIVGVH
jgi:hypothetical protein